MKLIEREKLLVNQPGTVKIIPEERDDFWLLHKLIAPNDHVAAETSRKIHQSTGSGAAKKPIRVRFDMEVKITAVDYDENSSVIRLKGKNITTNSYANGGAFHTLEIEKNKPFYLSKKSWDEVSIDSLREGCKRTSGADMAVVLIKEELALLYLVGRSVTDLCASIDGNRSNVTKFYEDVFHAFRKHVDFDIIRCVMIAGPGTTKNEFRRHLLSESKRLRLKSIEENESQILVRNVCSVSKV
ncbi:hypothetical protein Nepgr_014043 [Nepenthes gracilis]|uniref:eRF1/Pelota-like N-terminal domain-containing protein n=1 Tax=Nepenthes gracilis TaxID=150966 RepID=A0AAD3SJC6_NEPGR|nr:hypothetical protein Nepgr_014043 [Nepenthes gracilis]